MDEREAQKVLASRDMLQYIIMDAGELHKTMPSITDGFLRKANKQSTVRDQGLYTSLPYPIAGTLCCTSILSPRRSSAATTKVWW